ncbi:uncharacterized protein LOC109845432 isoform X1 [Asparagus officinalis]|uniref:uncharacterized protein LOC109845432 isoform X1 n=1 Tax=Asparagus officinalis TaxID=4686 RepID=UPI00098E3D05|nr:uncharacterized protein LOC109845432 isoform X1 [Asparagus officinalis]
MLCLKAEALGAEVYSASHGVILPVNLINRGGSLQKAMHRGGRKDPSSSSNSGDKSLSSSVFEDVKSKKSEKSGSYRFKLEKEVLILQKKLQKEIELHMALANAVLHSREALPTYPSNIPEEAQELVANIAELEIAVSKLEEELAALQFQFRHLKCLPSLSIEPPPSSSGLMWEERISSLRASNFGILQLPPSLKLEFRSLKQYETKIPTKNLTLKDLWNHPNRLSEEMVLCMRNIFLSLSKSTGSLKVSSSKLSSSSPVGHLSQSSFATPTRSFDPYRVNGKVNWNNIGSYSLADEVSCISVGKEQIEYAADTLKKFRFLLGELAKVDPSTMNNDQKLAFWINLYNSLIMHAYLAYGVPRNDIKFFALMQKVSYTIRGQSFSPADIEFVILKMKPPPHRPQIALALAIHTFKISEEHRLYSIDAPEPLLVFALSSGMFSSPAVRIFTAENIRYELEKSMRDYVQASIGISEKGKLLVPKLLHSFARGVIEDSLLVDWICRYLYPDQVTIVRDSTSQKKQRLLGARSFNIIPFDSRFRYLFLPDEERSTQNIEMCV